MSKIKTERFYRSATVELVGRENDDRRIEVAFSSEEPVERHFGLEVLDHAPSSVRVGRLMETGSRSSPHAQRRAIFGVFQSMVEKLNKLRMLRSR